VNAHPLASCLYAGEVRHRRHLPVENAFRYSVFFVYLDLWELDRVFAGRWLWSVSRPNVAWLRRRDHLGDPEVPLEESVRRLVGERLGSRPEGPIRLLTHLRYFGHNFNPVSFYYCFDPADQAVEAIVAEIHNTPWGETHCYVLGEDRNEGTREEKRFRFPKTFHVSPFLPMGLRYEWELSEPGEALRVQMADWDGDTKVFEARLTLVRRALTGRALASALVNHPAMTVKVVAAIYWQALRLKLKGAPFYAHP
jgi:DUF1365 family protein